MIRRIASRLRVRLIERPAFESWRPEPPEAPDLAGPDGRPLPRRLRLERQWLATGDRGWRQRLTALGALHHPAGVRFDGFVEARLLSLGDKAVHRRPWVGVVHGHPGLPVARLLDDPRWALSARHCAGLFALDDADARALAARHAFPVARLDRRAPPTELAARVAASDVYAALAPTPVEPFVLFAHPRSGSTTLERVLAVHPDLRILGEPFNPFLSSHDRGGRYRYLRDAGDAESLERCLDEIWFYYTGIRHLMAGRPAEGRHRPWDAERINRQILARPVRRILLTRRNRLRTVVSELMATQTWVWQRDEGRVEEPLEALDPDDVARRMEWLRADVEQYRAFLAERGLPFLELVYEDLFGPGVAPDARDARIREVFAWLGAREPDAAEWARIHALLDPARTRLNTPETYRLIPNAADIEARLGSDDTGHLLDDDDA